MYFKCCICHRLFVEDFVLESCLQSAHIPLKIKITGYSTPTSDVLEAGRRTLLHLPTCLTPPTPFWDRSGIILSSGAETNNFRLNELKAALLLSVYAVLGTPARADLHVDRR